MCLEAIRALVQSDLDATDLSINSALQTDIALIHQLSQHIIQSGGKRLRPLLVLLSAKAFNYPGNAHIDLAAIIELIHTATLLHDDVVDASDLRRGRETANAIWGNEASVLVGDFLYSRAFQMMVKIQNLDVMAMLSKATNTIAEGEILQLLNCHDPETTEARYMEVIRHKTGTLFEISAKLGAVISQRQANEIHNMANYGMHLGTAFQLIDDALDYNGSLNDIGKNSGDDLAEGKPTLPLIYALRHGNPSQQHFIRHAVKHGNRDNLQEILQTIESTNAIAYTYQVAKQQAEQAKLFLAEIPDSSYRNALYALAEFAVERKY